MPNLYTPAWMTEGLAVYYESRMTGFGRLAGTAHTTIAATMTAAIASDGAAVTIDDADARAAVSSLLWPAFSTTTTPLPPLRPAAPRRR